MLLVTQWIYNTLSRVTFDYSFVCFSLEFNGIYFSLPQHTEFQKNYTTILYFIIFRGHLFQQKVILLKVLSGWAIEREKNPPTSLYKRFLEKISDRHVVSLYHRRSGNGFSSDMIYVRFFWLRDGEDSIAPPPPAYDSGVWRPFALRRRISWIYETELQFSSLSISISDISSRWRWIDCRRFKILWCFVDP